MTTNTTKDQIDEYVDFELPEEDQNADTKNHIDTVKPG